MGAGRWCEAGAQGPEAKPEAPASRVTPRRGDRQPTPWRVVLDTDVVVSALLFTRSPAMRVREAWHAGRIVPLASRATADELVRVLAYPKFRLSADDQAELLAWLGTATAPPDAVYVVHGEPEPAETLRDLVAKRHAWSAVVPRQGERVCLD